MLEAVALVCAISRFASTFNVISPVILNPLNVVHNRFPYVPKCQDRGLWTVVMFLLLFLVCNSLTEPELVLRPAEEWSGAELHRSADFLDGSNSHCCHAKRR